MRFEAKQGRTGGLRVRAATALLLLLLATMASATSCTLLGGTPDEVDPVPDFDSALTASQIWEAYQSASDNFANDRYRNKWAVIILDGVRKEAGTPAGVDAIAGTRLVIRTPGTISSMEFQLQFESQASEYTEGGPTQRVLCNIAGPDLAGRKLTFVHCRPETTG